MNESQEADLVRRCQTGDLEAFRALVERYHSTLFGTAYLMVQDRGRAEDAVQDALVQIWKHFPSFRSKSSVKTWLVRIVINEVKQQLRKKGLSMASLEETSEVASGQADSETVLICDEERRNLRQALARLPSGQRDAVVLRYFSGFTVPEIAIALRQPEGTVKSRLSRALELLKQIFSADKV